MGAIPVSRKSPRKPAQDRHQTGDYRRNVKIRALPLTVGRTGRLLQWLLSLMSSRQRLLELAYELLKADLEDSADISQFHQVQASYTALDVAHEGLAATEGGRTSRLSDASPHALFLQKLQENSVLISMDCLRHGRPLVYGLERYILISDI